MSDTKKEHFVPQCYLENFASEGNRIDVFDKWKLNIRANQDILNVAMENLFYDVDLLGILSRLEPSKQEKCKADLMEITQAETWEDVERIIGNKKYIEKKHFAETIESVYSPVLKSIIRKSYNGNTWVLKNCDSISEDEKVLMAMFIAIQEIRTRRFRDNLADMIAGTAQVLPYKSGMIDEKEFPQGSFKVKANPEYVKLQHSLMILDPEAALHIAEILVDHIWVMYINKTSIPYFTSDDPVVKIPHKHDGFVSHSGFASPGIEIAFPISPTMLLCIYDCKWYGHIFRDRQFMEMTDPKDVEYYNMQQVINSYRCVFANGTDFSHAKKYCQEHPELQSYQPHVEVI